MKWKKMIVQLPRNMETSHQKNQKKNESTSCSTYECERFGSIECAHLEKKITHKFEYWILFTRQRNNKRAQKSVEFEQQMKRLKTVSKTDGKKKNTNSYSRREVLRKQPEITTDLLKMECGAA